MACDCLDYCDEFKHCMCVYDYDEGTCSCECWGAMGANLAPSKSKGPAPHPLGRKAKVNIETRNVTMVELATRLTKWCDFEILVPARTIEIEVTKKLTNVHLESAIKELGMLIADPQ